jgi:small nuclear ribonucleoprotein (snRNP)-like protein
MAAVQHEADLKESWASHSAAAVVKAAIGRSVVIVLNDGRELKGTCTCFDWLGNLVLSKWTQRVPLPSGLPRAALPLLI